MVGVHHLSADPRHRSIVRRALALAVAAAFLAPGSAWLAGPDDLAQTIEQNLSGIEFRLGIAPERVAPELEEQKRRLRLLREQAPDHPMVPELTRQIERLESQLAEQPGGGEPAAPTAAGAASGATTAEELLGPREPPSEVADRLREIEQRLAEAEAGMMQGQTDAAAERLSEADAMMAELESNYADRLPAGHVPLIVAKERLGALKEQLGAAE